MKTYRFDTTSIAGFVRLSAVAASAAAIVTTLLLSPPALAGQFTEYDSSGPIFGGGVTEESGSAVARAPKTQERLQQAAQAGNIMTDASVAAAPHLGDGEILSLRYSNRPGR